MKEKLAEFVQLNFSTTCYKTFFEIRFCQVDILDKSEKQIELKALL